MSVPERERRLEEEIARLNARLAKTEEAFETLEAIRAGEIDALVIDGKHGPETYTLRTADQPYRVLVQEIAEAAFIVSESGVTLFENPAAKALLDPSSSGRDFADVFRAADRNAVRALLARGRGSFEGTLAKSDGSTVDVRLSISPMTSDGERRFAAVMADLSEHNRLVSSQAANAAKAQFLSLLGHEIRNPLGSLRTALSVMYEASEPEVQRNMNEVASREITHIAALVDDLLDLARIDQGKLHVELKRVELCEVLKESVSAHQLVAQARQIDLRLDLSGDLWVDADLTRFRQVMHNLLANAFNATPKGGTVQVSAGRDLAEREVLITVQDSGQGISSDQLERIFAPFEQVNTSLRSRKGLGLGLPLARGLVEAQQAQLTVRSEGIGCGATFELRFALREAVAAAVRVDPPVASSRSLRLLIVDDHRDFADALRLLLQSDRHRVAVAYTAREAFALVESETFDVVLSDVGLPDEDGLTLGQRIQDSEHFHGTLLALTGFADDDMLRQLTAAGFSKRFPKPVDPRELRNFLRTLAQSEQQRAC